jgi:DNA-binding transcriptional LysR family regulator
LPEDTGLAGAAFEAAGLGVVVVSAAEAIGGFAETLFDEPNVIVAGPDSHWAKRRSLKLADLTKERWGLAQPGSLARSLHDDTFRRNGFEPPSATVLTVWLDLYMRTLTPLAERFIDCARTIANSVTVRAVS